MVALPHMGSVGTCVIQGAGQDAIVLQVGSLAIRQGWRANTFCTALNQALQHIPPSGSRVVGKLIVVRPAEGADHLTHQVAGACWLHLDSMRMETAFQAMTLPQADPVAFVRSWLQRRGDGHDTFVHAATEREAASLALLTALHIVHATEIEAGDEDDEDDEDGEDDDDNDEEDEEEQ
jgi:hypothetical protein